VSILTIESFRILHKAIQSGDPVAEYLHKTKFDDGLIGPYHFNEDGEVVGIEFNLQTIKHGTAFPLR